MVILALASSGSSSGSPSMPSIVAGQLHTCALRTDSGVTCWGWNGDGQLGDGTTTDRATPVPVSGLTSEVVAVAAGFDQTCALLVGGGVECWGGNVEGELGDGTRTERDEPVAVSGLTSGVKAIAAGGNHTCALVGGGGVECWGYNAFGQLGDGTTTERLTPVAVTYLASGVQAISAGLHHTCALLSGGGVKCWGSNDAGQIGDGSPFEPHTPVFVSGLASGVKAISAGDYHTCALLSSGEVECWGSNLFGQLGDGTRKDRRTPVAVYGLGSGVQAIAAGGLHTCALLSSGGVKCWGSNHYGQLGDGTRKDRRTPVAVSGLGSGVQAIAAGGDHTCALLSGGGFKCWGWNLYGQLGNGTFDHTLTVQIRGRGTVRAIGFRCSRPPSRACDLARASGTAVVLTAQDAKGWVFGSWLGACKGRAKRCTVKLNKDATTTARFVHRRSRPAGPGRPETSAGIRLRVVVPSPRSP
jgi:alpha-tubulin suppressor-like RCC1 family protein